MPALITIINGTILTLIPLFLVFFTGGLRSPVFFLFYFLLFGFAMLFSPLVTLLLSFSLSLALIQQAQGINDYLQIFSIILTTPAALFFSHQYLKGLENEDKIKILNRKKSLLQKEVTQQEQDTLLWLSLMFKDKLIQISDETSNLLADVSRLTPSQKTRLNNIHKQALELIKLGNELKQKIEN